MSWQDETKPASYRGLAFEGLELGETGGNRLVIDELPESDDHTIGELGNKADRFTMRGFVEGDDYLDQLGSLKAAFKRRGAGELVHPWRGQLLVKVEDWTFNYDTGGGVGEFEISCVVAGIETRPTVLVVTETDVLEKGAAARDASYDDDAVAAFTAVLAALPSYLRAVSAAALTAENEDLARALGVPDADIAQALGTRDALLETVDAAEDLTALIRYLTRADMNVPTSSGTEAGDAMVEATAAYILSIRVAVITRACDLAVEQDFASAEGAIEMQNILTGIIDAELNAEPADETFTALYDLRTSLSAALSDIASRLPRERVLTVVRPRPAMLIAFDLYGSVAREDEILGLNASSHPGFMVGDLTVLSS